MQLVALLLAILLPGVGPEVAISPQTSTAAVSQFGARLASDGSQLFMVWLDRRGGATVRVYGSPVDANGVPAVPEGILVSGDSLDAGNASVVRMGDHWVVLWTNGAQLLARRVGSDLRFFDEQPIVLLTAPRFEYPTPAAVAATDQVLLLAGAARGEAYRLYDTDLRFLMAAPVDPSLETADLRFDTTGVATDGRNFVLVCFPLTAAPFAMHITSDGKALTRTIGEVLLPGHDAFLSRLVWSGDDYLLVWNEIVSPGDRAPFGRYFGAHLDQGGQPKEQAFPITDASFADNFAVASRPNGDAVLVVSDVNELGAVAVRGRTVTGKRVIERSAAPGAIAAIGSGYVAAVSINGQAILKIVAFDADAQPQRVSQPMTAVTPQSNPQHDPNGRSGWLAWLEEGADPFCVVANNHRIACNALPGAIADGPGHHLVVYSELLSVRKVARVIDDNGRALAPDVGFESTSPFLAAAWSGSEYLVAVAGQRSTIRILRISPAGELVAFSEVARADLLPTRVALVRTPDGFLLVFQEGDDPCPPVPCAPRPPARISAVRLDVTGRQIDTARTIISDSSRYAIHPAAAWNGNTVGIAWESPDGIRGALVDPRTMVTIPLTISRETGKQETPSIGPFGSSFLVAWTRGEDVVGSFVDIYGAGAPFTISNAPFRNASPVVMVNVEGDASVAYVRTADEAGGSRRLFQRTVAPGATTRWRRAR